MIKNIEKNKYINIWSKNKYLILVLVLILFLILSTSSYIFNQIKIENYKVELNNYLSRGIGAINIEVNFDMTNNLYLPDWPSFFNRANKEVYNYLGYNLSLIIDLLQFSVIFFSGIGLVNILIFNGGDSTSTIDNSPIDFNSLFWKIYLLAFIIYIVFIAVSILRAARNRSNQQGKMEMLKALANGTISILLCLILIPSIFILVNVVIYLVFLLFFPFVINILSGNIDTGTGIGSESIFGKYTISTLLFNSSFFGDMGTFGYVPDGSQIFPEDIYNYDLFFKLNDVTIGITNDIFPDGFLEVDIPINLILINESWTFQIPPAGGRILSGEINLTLFYIAEFITTYLLIRILIKLGYSIFSLFTLFIMGPLFFATNSIDNGTRFKQWAKNVAIHTLTMIGISSSFLLFTTTIPAILINLNLMILSNPDLYIGINWIGLVYIATIWSGLYFTYKFDILIKKYFNDENISNKQNIEIKLNDTDIYKQQNNESIEEII